MSRLSECITLDQLFAAYRKAKADIFFERSQPTALKFCQYEEDLTGNLTVLLERLIAEPRTWCNEADFIGGYFFLPKRLEFNLGGNDGPRFNASDPDDAWRNFVKQHEPNSLKPEFRAVADFSVNMHVVSALWINLIGHKYDSCVGEWSVGSRVRRLANEAKSKSHARPYHRTVWQTFQPYFQSYTRWRSNGFKAIRGELASGSKVIAITMDLARFYHNVDPDFLLNPDYLEASGFLETNGQLSEFEIDFTRSLISCFQRWAANIPGFDPANPVGLPVGASASRVIANAALASFDKELVHALAPIYYGRYVDDIFLVIRDTGTLHTSSEIMHSICNAVPCLHYEADRISIRLPGLEKSRLMLQQEKQRVFRIDNADLLDTIEAKIDEVSSEWRLLPDLNDIEKSPAARVLTAAFRPDDDADSLRKADSLSLRRLGFALLLRSIEAVVRDLPPNEWKLERERFYDFAMRHVVNQFRIFELFDYVPRLLSIAVVCRDWKYAGRIVNRLSAVVQDIKQLSEPSERAPKWNGFFRYIRYSLEEASLQSVPFWKAGGEWKKLSELRLRLTEIAPDFFDFFDESSIVMAEKLFCRDLARTPYKSAILREESIRTAHSSPLASNLPEEFQKRSEVIVEILQATRRNMNEQMAMLFPTRPLSAEDITECIPSCVWEVTKWVNYANALRGTWHKGFTDDPSNRGRTICIGASEVPVRAPRLAVTSFQTESDCWHGAAAGKPQLSRNRYVRLVKLCNEIVRTSIDCRPTHVIFPELSIPRRWLRCVADHFLRYRISVIMGSEYRHHSAGCVSNEAKLYLTDNRLGYPSWCALTQQKANPAPGERNDLRAKFGIAMCPDDVTYAKKRVYSHFGFNFGILICSELTDLKYRKRFRGHVDSLFVLSWNRDLESFAALLDSATLDVHCFMALVNNREFGDSRVRAPYKESWQRDLVRIKGGKADYFVVAELDITSLRQFQSHKESPEAPFKPVPEGYIVASDREEIPGVRRSRHG